MFPSNPADVNSSYRANPQRPVESDGLWITALPTVNNGIIGLKPISNTLFYITKMEN